VTVEYAAAATLVVAQSGLIAALLLHRARRRQAEAQLRERETQLRRSYDRLRDIGVRLISAQEDERSRIARELHDDIGQQVALLGIELHDTADPAMADRVSALAKSIHELSHRLHPTKLRLLGLVDALRALQQEQSRGAMTVSFTHDEMPEGLSPELTLCLFRVAQEALQNATKYSCARRVSVSLKRVGEALRLTIEDDGIGFDTESAWGRGLGLVSIKERVEASGGAVTIRSQPGEGVAIHVLAPLQFESAPGGPGRATMGGGGYARAQSHSGPGAPPRHDRRLDPAERDRLLAGRAGHAVHLRAAQSGQA
jgi:signal transduction histidine kinase